MGLPSDPAARRRRLWLAAAIAIVVDAVQIAIMPLFAEGALSPANDVLDALASVAFVWLLGWHPALLPALVAELVPGVDLVPTWTAAVAIVAWTRRRAPAAPAAPPGSRAEVVPEEDPARELPPRR